MPSTAGGFCPHCQKSYFPQTPEQTLIRALTHLRTSSTHHCNEPEAQIPGLNFQRSWKCLLRRAL